MWTMLLLILIYESLPITKHDISAMDFIKQHEKREIKWFYWGRSFTLRWFIMFIYSWFQAKCEEESQDWEHRKQHQPFRQSSGIFSNQSIFFLLFAFCLTAPVSHFHLLLLKSLSSCFQPCVCCTAAVVVVFCICPVHNKICSSSRNAIN